MSSSPPTPVHPIPPALLRGYLRNVLIYFSCLVVLCGHQAILVMSQLQPSLQQEDTGSDRSPYSSRASEQSETQASEENIANVAALAEVARAMQDMYHALNGVLSASSEPPTSSSSVAQSDDHQTRAIMYIENDMLLLDDVRSYLAMAVMKDPLFCEAYATMTDPDFRRDFALTYWQDKMSEQSAAHPASSGF